MRGIHQHAVRPGLKFNRWTVVQAYVDHDSDKRWKHTCKCKCGTIRDVAEKSLKNGASKSCGCWSREQLIARNKAKGARVTADGKVYFLSELAKEAGYEPNVVSARFHRYGWNVPRALLEKLHYQPKTGRTTLPHLPLAITCEHRGPRYAAQRRERMRP
jgi:hypothetical protein